jgi:Icc-related predicted phosphoesterase
MRILAVSDRVLDRLYCTDVWKKFPDIKLLVGCGDLPFYYLEFLVSSLDARMVYVRGNHDKGPQYTITGKILEQVQGGDDVHGRVIKREGLLIAGLEGSMRYRPDAPFMYSENEMRYQISRLLPRLLINKIRYGRFLDILVTHSPPFGIHDRNDLPHTGFRGFLPLLKWVQPRYMLHGHIHLYRRDAIAVTQYEQTTIINVYPYFAFDYHKPPKRRQLRSI